MAKTSVDSSRLPWVVCDTHDPSVEVIMRPAKHAPMANSQPLVNLAGLFKWRFIVVLIVGFCGTALSLFLMLGIFNKSPSLEVHAIGVYEGAVKPDVSDELPTARISVDRSGQNIILALGSYEAVGWVIETSTDTNIVGIYLHGYHADQSEVILNGAPINAPLLDLEYAIKNEGSSFRELVTKLTSHFDVDFISSFHSAYSAPDVPFLVNSVQKDATYRVGYLLSAVQPRAITRGLRERTATGEVPAARLGNDGFYLLWEGEEMHFPLPPETPPVSVPSIAAYDPVNERLHAGTNWHVGHFYTYDIPSESWFIVEQPRGMRVHGVIYDTHQDRLILGVTGHSDRTTNSNRLAELRNTNEITALNHDILLGLSDLEDIDNGLRAFLIPIAIDNNMLLVKGQADFEEKAYRTYVIDLENGDVTLVDFDD